MVFKGRFFSSKKSDSSSHDGSNSPRSDSNSPIRSGKKNLKSNFKDEAGRGGDAAVASTNFAAKLNQLKDGAEKKEMKGKEIEKPLKPKMSKAANLNEDKEAALAVSPILASSLGLNRIKTRSGPLPQESFYGYRGEKGSGLGASNLSKNSANGGDLSSGSSGSGPGSWGSKKKDVSLSQSRMGQTQESSTLSGSWMDNGSNSNGMSPASVQSRGQSPNLPLPPGLQNGESSSGAGRIDSSWNRSGGLRSSDVCIPEESESPRFQAILRVTNPPKKRFPADIKSFSHELNSKGVRPFPFWKHRGLNNVEETLVVIRAKFDKAKEEVNSDLAIYAADLVGLLEKNSESHPEWQEPIEDLLVLARSCAMTSPGEFWLQCEGIVQELDDRRQELSMGMLKQLHTRMLFILTRCTRLLQFHKETGWAEDEQLFNLRQSRLLHPPDKVGIPLPGPVREGNVFAAKSSKTSSSARKSYSQEQHHVSEWKKSQSIQPEKVLPPLPDENQKEDLDASIDRHRMASWKKFPSPATKSQKESLPSKGQSENKVEIVKVPSNKRGTSTAVDVTTPKLTERELPDESKHQHKPSWGWGDQQNPSEENSIICRICEEDVPTLHVEDHSRICALADRCDQNGMTVNERLLRISEMLEKMLDSSQKDIHHVDSPDVAKVSNSSVTEDSDVLSPKFSDWSRRGSEDMLDYLPEVDNSALMDDMKGLPSVACKTRFSLKSASSAGSMTPRSPLLTPRTSQIDLLLSGKGVYSESEDFPQMNELADIARCVANTPLEDERSMPYMLTCLEDLRVVIDRRKFDALTVETFGARIEKLIKEKYLQLCEMVDDEKLDVTSTVIDEDAPMEDDVVRSLRTSPIHPSKDRTSIDDFEIIKPISRGAFGRVFLAKKRTTGDIFAMKVLKKADMIRKNAVESILAERNILISVRNPFVVRFFYSFTCRENLYLVMEYLNGGDLYSLLRNLGCLDEDVARVYIAEVVLALEYLHSLRVVHRDLKPDNLLIARDGHIKLTDFGLSRVGLINSTDDLSGPVVSGTSMLEDEEPQIPLSEHQKERRKKRSAVGTPDYLAPEILLGTGHGTTADWWSVGVILFELIVGIPPFNAEHPQIIFDNILNRNIPWPRVPEEMSPETADLIDRLLTEDPHQRLGAQGAWEVKQHIFFKDINWDTLARQKAAFVPASESPLDTSYFTSRYSWNTNGNNHSDDHAYPGSDLENSSDADSLSGSSSISNRQEEVGDEFESYAEFDSGASINYSFSNFSFKNLSQLASINYDLLSKEWKDDPPKG